jgi:antitoxin MazE
MDSNSTRVAKWGDDLAVRLPEALVEDLHLKEGNEVEIRVAVKPSLEMPDERVRQEALKRLRKLRRPLPPGFKFDRMEANRRDFGAFWLYVNFPNNTAKAHRPDCPVPSRRKFDSNENGYWVRFSSARAAEAAGRATRHEFWWCRCPVCKLDQTDASA